MPPELLHESWENGSCNEFPQVSLKRFYKCKKAEQYIEFIQKSPRKDTITEIDDYGCFWVNGVEMNRVLSKQEGEFLFCADYNLRILSPEEEMYARLPPWCYPVEDLTFSSEEKEVSVDAYYPPDEMIAYPFINTAGVPLEATGVKGLTRMSFSWNSYGFDPNYTWLAKSKINSRECRICNLVCPERTILMNDCQGSEVIEYNPEGGIKWRYFKISVVLLLNPDTWNEKYLNVGTHAINPETNKLEEIWRIPTRQGTSYCFHTYYVDLNRTRNGYGNGDPISTPMFLSPSGYWLSDFVSVRLPGGGSTIRQRPVYLIGSLFEPMDFNMYGMPTTRGWRT